MYAFCSDEVLHEYTGGKKKIPEAIFFYCAVFFPGLIK